MEPTITQSRLELSTLATIKHNEGLFYYHRATHSSVRVLESYDNPCGFSTGSYYYFFQYISIYTYIYIYTSPGWP